MKRVYFIKPVGNSGPVKIGCSANPQQRLAHITRQRRPMEIAAIIEGDFRVERQFHAMFRADHIGSEWFFWSTEMQAVIEAIASGNFDVSALPEPQRLPRKQIEYTPERRARMSADARRNNAWLKAYRAAKVTADSDGRDVWHSDVNRFLNPSTDQAA